MKLTAKKSDENSRLDKFLTPKIKDLSRSQIKKLIKNGQILVNDKPAVVHQFLKPGDVVTVTKTKTKLQQPQTLPTEPTQIIVPQIIFENQDFIVLDKPIDLLVHPTEKNEANALVDWLTEKYPEIKNVGQENYRAGIIHRLDRDVSGVMLAAKTQAGFEHLKNQFKNRQVKKIYLAIVYGKMTEPSGEIDLPIGRSNKTGQFVAHPRQGDEKFQPADKIAKTKYRVSDYIKDYSVLEIQILTGRTHQIRAHLFAVGHPIIGDHIYKPKKKIFNFLRRRIKVIAPNRIFLHSQKIGFYDLKNEWVEFESPTPREINNFINATKTK